MITRKIEPVLKAVSRQFKAVAITGPRQSGKTTLAKMAFAGDDAVNPTLIYGGDTVWKEGPTAILPWEQITDLAERI